MLALMLLQIIKKPLLYILPFLLLSSLAWAESELSECEGSPTKDNAITQKWTDCHGTTTSTDEDGSSFKYVGEWKDGKWHGQGTHTWPDGIKYVGEFKDNKYHGQGAITSPDGKKYVGEFKDGKEHGQGTLTVPE